MIMNRPTVKEDLYELHHVQGSSGFWKKIRAELIEPASRESNPKPQRFPPINVSDNRRTNLVAKSHTTGYHGDSPTPPKGLQTISNEQTKHLGWTTRPPNPNASNQLSCKSSNNEKQQGGVLDKYNQTNPIPLHRGKVEAMEEPTVRKTKKKKRVDNAINRVNKSYVIDPRTYQEPDINGHLDSKFIPAPPTCPKPQKHRKHNVVIVDPEKMLRERNHMRGDFAPGRPPGHVPESCHSRLAAQIAAPIIGHESTTSQNAHESHIDHNPTSVHNSCAAPSVRSGVHSYNQRYAYGQSAADTHRVCHPQEEVYDNHGVAETCELPQSHGQTTLCNAFESQNAAYTSISMHNSSAAPSVRSGLSPHNQRYAYGHSAADNYSPCPQQGNVHNNRPASVLRTTAPDQAKEWHQDHTKHVNMAKERVQQEYVDGPRHEDSGSISSKVEIDLDRKRQQMLARKFTKKRKKEVVSKKIKQKTTRKHGSTIHQTDQINQMDQPFQQTTSHFKDDAITAEKENDYSFKRDHQIHIPRSTKRIHAPTIRVEPQLTWDASAAKRGLGFKSKLRREQEEAARQNIGPDFNDASPSTPKLSEEARRRWRSKTMFN